MDLSGKSQKELQELVIQLASSMKEEDLKNPETYGLVSQLLQVLNPTADPMHPEHAAQLDKLTDHADRFRQAALQIGAMRPDHMDKLKDSMKQAGLLKSDREIDEALSKVAFDTTDSHILMFPVSIRGQHKNSLGRDYHITLKWLGKHGPDPLPIQDTIQGLVDKHGLAPISNLRTKTHEFQTPNGTHHILLLDSAHPELHQANKELESFGSKSPHPYLPHITVPEEIHREAKEKGLSAEDLDIKVHPLEYRIGDKLIQRFAPAPQASAHFPETRKLAASESRDIEDILAKAIEILEKRSKNVREQIKRLNSGKDADKKHVERVTAYAKKTIGLDAAPRMPQLKELAQKHGGDTSKVSNADKESAHWKEYGAKYDKKGGRKPLDERKFERKPKIDTENGQFTISHMGSKKSLQHEVSHYLRANKGAKALDEAMQEGFGKIKKQKGKAGNQFAHAGEYETQGFEQKLSRRIGSTPIKTQVQDAEFAAKGAKKSKGPKTAAHAPQLGMSGHKKGQPIHRVIPSKDGKGRHINHLTENMRPEQHTKMDMIDNGEIKFDKEKGWQESNSTNAKINGRAAGRRDKPIDMQRKGTKPQKAPKANERVEAGSGPSAPKSFTMFTKSQSNKKGPKSGIPEHFSHDEKGRPVGVKGVPDQPTRVHPKGEGRAVDTTEYESEGDYDVQVSPRISKLVGLDKSLKPGMSYNDLKKSWSEDQSAKKKSLRSLDQEHRKARNMTPSQHREYLRDQKAKDEAAKKEGETSAKPLSPMEAAMAAIAAQNKKQAGDK